MEAAGDTAFHLRGQCTIVLLLPHREALGGAQTQSGELDWLASGRTSGVASSWGAHRGHRSCAGTPTTVAGLTGTHIRLPQPGPHRSLSPGESLRPRPGCLLQLLPTNGLPRLRLQPLLKPLKPAAAGDSVPQAYR